MLRFSSPYAYLKRKLGITEVIAGIAGLRDLITSLPENIAMAIRPEIQAVLDAINGLSAPLAALEAAQTAELAQIKDLTDKVAAGGQLSDDEKTALTAAVSTITDLTANVVAATPAATSAAAAVTA